jgi:sialic acid synthase SpsE
MRFAHQALGDGIKRPVPCELPNLPLIRKSLVANGAIATGTRLTREMLEIKRPATGIEPADLGKVIGLRAQRDIEDDEPITWAMLAG